MSHVLEQFHVLEHIDVYTKLSSQLKEYEEYELDEYFVFPTILEPVIKNGMVLYRSEDELKDILNKCWRYTIVDTLWTDDTVYFYGRVDECYKFGDTMIIKIIYEPDDYVEGMNLAIHQFQTDVIEDSMLNAGLDELAKMGVRGMDINFNRDDQETLFIEHEIRKMKVRDAMVHRRFINSDSPIIEHVLDRYSQLQVRIYKMEIEHFQQKNKHFLQQNLPDTISPLEDVIDIEAWEEERNKYRRSELMTVEDFNRRYEELSQVRPNIQIDVMDELVSYDNIDIPCRLFTTELERNVVYDIKTVKSILESTRTSPITRKPITRIQIMDDALIESFNADHAHIQAGETKIQELHEHVAQQEQKLDQLSLEWRQLTKLVNLTQSVRDAKAAWKNTKKQAAQAVRDAKAAVRDAKAAWQNAKKQARKDVTSDYKRLSAARRRVHSSIKRSRTKITGNETVIKEARQRRHIRVVDMLRF